MMCLSCALRCDYGAGWRARKGGHSATNGRDHNTHTHTHIKQEKTTTETEYNKQNGINTKCEVMSDIKVMAYARQRAPLAYPTTPWPPAKGLAVR